MKSHQLPRPSSALLAATFLLSSLAAHAADPDATAGMQKMAATVEANAANDEPGSSPSDPGISMGGASNTAGMKMGQDGSMDASPSSPGMMGMMSGMKGKMGKMKMSMDEMKGMSGDKAMKSKMEGMESMMADMEGMMESMMGGMANDGGMMEMKKDGMGGMRMMGAMGETSSMKSALPGFPGASHLYHVGSTGFFLDHEEHITLSTEQTKALEEIAEKSLLDQAATDRQIAEANQTLFTLTGADQPDAEKIDTEITEIENLAAERRRAFIRQVGKAAQLLTEDQRKILVGQPMPDASTPATSDSGMSDM
ncbi:MAG: periplasmic heavy metal sensor [Chthoniobacterales bacterium]